MVYNEGAKPDHTVGVCNGEPELVPGIELAAVWLHPRGGPSQMETLRLPAQVAGLSDSLALRNGSS